MDDQSAVSMSTSDHLESYVVVEHDDHPRGDVHQDQEGGGGGQDSDHNTVQLNQGIEQPIAMEEDIGNRGLANGADPSMETSTSSSSASTSSSSASSASATSYSISVAELRQRGVPLREQLNR